METQKQYRYLYIPLSFLQRTNSKHKLPLSEIIGWAIINFAKNIKYEEQSVMKQTLYCYFRKSPKNDISNNIYSQIYNAVINRTIVNDEYYNGFSGSEFNPEYELETFEPFFNKNLKFKNECIANYQFNIALKNSGLISNFENCYSDYNLLNKKLIEYEDKNGKDIYVSLKSSYLIDAMNNNISENIIRFIVAIKSIIQKRNYKLTYKNVIIRRMFGCKTDEIFLNYKMENETVIPGIEQINKRYRFDKLLKEVQGRGFFTYIPAGRGYYISTKYKVEELKTKVMKYISKYDTHKNKAASNDIRSLKKKLNNTNATIQQHQNNIITTPINDTILNNSFFNNSLNNYIKNNISHQSKN